MADKIYRLTFQKDDGTEESVEFTSPQGDKGDPGVSATHSWNGTILTITSASGSSAADLKGDKGDKGDTGAKPVKGADYFTEADKVEIAEQAAQMVNVPDVDLSDYAKTDDIPTKPEDIGAQPAGNYLTEVPNGYATEEFVKNKIAEAELGGEEVDLSGYAQKSELPTKISQLQNDAGYAKTEDVPTKPADIGAQPEGDYALRSEIPSVPVQSVNGKTGAVSLSASDVGALPSSTVIPTVPTKVSAFENDKGYLAEHQDLSGYAKTSDIPTKPEDIGAQPSGNYALKSEIPTVPVQSVNNKTGAVVLSASDVGARPSTWTPTYSDVGADKSGTASSAVSTHNTKTDAHNDIRLLISGLTTRLDALANSDDDTLDQMAEVVAYIKANRDLIEQVTNGKVSVTDIVNNLTTNVTNKPLSAAQGVALKALIDVLNDEKLDASALSTAINTALAQAKASGEFNGAAGPKGDKGDTGESGTSVTVKSVSESTADGGSNVVTFSDGKTVTIKNGSKGKDGKDGIDATPVVPLFVNTIAECTDTTKPYVLPDGFIYAYMMKETTGGAGYTNLVPTSTDTDGSVYNKTGYKDNTRLSSSGSVSGSAQNGSVVTGFMPWQSNGVIRIKGARFEKRNNEHFYLMFYSSNKTLVNTYSYLTPDDQNDKYAYSYDETTGVTTIDFSGVTVTSDWSKGVVNGTYFRINAYGKGADLIVTVNQEIKEAEPTLTYQCTNTGHAFVPADYEELIVANKTATERNAANIAKNTGAIGTLEGKVEAILDGEAEISASTKFDPTVYDLPILKLYGDTSPIAVSKDNKVTLSYVYGERSGTCTLKGQGATSYKMAKAFIDAGKAGKFNYTINFDTKFEAVEGWGAQKKYCLKANWIDHTHSRNIVSCKLWGMTVKSRSNVPAELANLPNAGAIDGFPILIMLNDEFHGLYTWNIPKDGWMFGLVEDTTKTQAIVGADDHTAATQFKEASMTGYEVEFVSDEDNAAWVETSLTRMISAVMKSNGSDLDTTVAQYLDLDSVIDHYIHTVVDKALDCVDKNFLLVTFDGVKWYMSAYDRDSIHGLNWDASGTTRPVSNVSFAECAATVKVYELIKTYKTGALKARYNQLRGNILSESRIMEKFENFAWAIPSTVLAEDVKKYPTIRGSSVNTIDQIGRFVRQRLETTDKWIAEL